MAKFAKDKLFSCENTQNQKKMFNVPLVPTQLGLNEDIYAEFQLSMAKFAKDKLFSCENTNKIRKNVQYSFSTYAIRLKMKIFMQSFN